MKTPRAIVLLLVALVFCSHAQAQNPAKAAFTQLLDDIPPTEALRRDAALVQRPEAAPNKQDVEDAQKRLAKAKIAIPKLRKLITVGSSVFDYPGLLAHGRITYGAGYRLYFGAYFSGAEGHGPYDFNVVFNDTGIITAVDDVRWKK